MRRWRELGGWSSRARRRGSRGARRCDSRGTRWRVIYWVAAAREQQGSRRRDLLRGGDVRPRTVVEERVLGRVAAGARIRGAQVGEEHR